MRKPYKRITQDEKDKMIALYQEGKTINQIAKIMGQFYGTVQRQIDNPAKRIFQYRIFTPDEIALIEECYDTGGSVNMLAKKIKCNPNTIYGYGRRKRLTRKQKPVKIDPELDRRLDAALDEFINPELLGSSWNFEKGMR